MPERAHVTSSQAIESFRTTLLVYLTKVRPVLEEATGEVSRVRQWLQADRRLHWEAQVRRRAKELEQARQALFSAGLVGLRAPSSAEQAGVHRATHLLADAEAKLKAVKRWSHDFDNRVGPLLKQMDQLRTVLDQDMPNAAAHLAQTVRLLEAYAAVPGVGMAVLGDGVAPDRSNAEAKVSGNASSGKPEGGAS